MIDLAQLDGWIPVRLYWRDGQPIVDWCYFGQQRFTDPLFNQTIEQRLRLPGNLLFRHQTPIEILGDLRETQHGLAPSGFIFHMSRCGSTLVSQILAALPSAIVISEAPPIDSILRANLRDPTVTDDQRVEWLRWMLSALARPQSREEKHFFVKFDAWNTRGVPLVRRAFPDVPWIFIYRDPVEVLVSQLDQRGAHMVPGVIDPSVFGMDLNTAISVTPEEYCARVLASILEAALKHHQGGMLLNYTQLPEIIWSSVLEFFRVVHTEAEAEAMHHVAGRNAKNPVLSFESDSDQKRREATAAVKKAADEWLYPLYEELEIQRAKSQAEPVEA